MPNELPIHAETLRSRPDVTAVVHAHPAGRRGRRPGRTGLTATGTSIAEAVVRALNTDSLARMILSAAQAGGLPADLPEADVAELPYLGATLDTASVWRYHLARLAHAGRGPRRRRSLMIIDASRSWRGRTGSR